MWERIPSAERSGGSLPVNRQGLSMRRHMRRRRGIIAFTVLLLFLLMAGVYGLWQPAVRIARVEVYGGDSSLAQYATEAMRGSYFGIIPRDSIFFFPASHIRAAILAAHTDIAAVSIFRNGFTALSLKPTERVAIAHWCGLSPTGGGVEEYCYVFDANGFIFAAASTSIQTINSFALYAPLEKETLEPLYATVAHANRIPALFDFARQLDTQGSPVTHVVVRKDEVDDFLASGTRITYVLGHEKNAFTALVSAHENFNLSDGSLEYVDLRFDGKVYIKKVEARK